MGRRPAKVQFAHDGALTATRATSQENGITMIKKKNCSRSFIHGMVVFLTLVVAALPGIAGAGQVTDAIGRQVTVPDNPKRILLGFYFEDYFAVAGPRGYDRVVAISRDAWEAWRHLQWQTYVKAVPRIAQLVDVGEVTGGTFSLEKVTAARPDLALLSSWQFSALGDQVARLEAAGIPVVVLDYNAQTVEKHVASTLVLGEILGAEARARELATLYADAHKDVARRVANITSRPKVYVELARHGAGEVDNSYGDVMWGAMVTAAGGDNIGKGKIAKWGPLSPEYVLAQNPERVVLAGSGWMSREKAVVLGPGVKPSLTHARMRPYLDRPGWRGLAAVRAGQVYAVYHGGARTLYDFAYLQYLAKMLHPDLFADVDPAANLAAYFEKYMPVRLTGTYTTRLP